MIFLLIIALVGIAVLICLKSPKFSTLSGNAKHQDENEISLTQCDKCGIYAANCVKKSGRFYCENCISSI